MREKVKMNFEEIELIQSEFNKSPLELEEFINSEEFIENHGDLVKRIGSANIVNLLHPKVEDSTSKHASVAIMGRDTVLAMGMGRGTTSGIIRSLNCFQEEFKGSGFINPDDFIKSDGIFVRYSELILTVGTEILCKYLNDTLEVKYLDDHADMSKIVMPDGSYFSLDFTDLIGTDKNLSTDYYSECMAKRKELIMKKSSAFINKKAGKGKKKRKR